MDNRQDNLVEEVLAVGGGVKDLAASIRNKAKAKKAQKISDAGDYLTLTPFQKSLIDVPDYILNDAREAGVTPDDIRNAAPVRDLKYYLPFIIGGTVLLVLAYVIFKK